MTWLERGYILKENFFQRSDQDKFALPKCKLKSPKIFKQNCEKFLIDFPCLVPTLIDE
jgi:hypothetical protein